MDDLILNILTIALLVESIVLHEVAHGYVANLFGDPTARRLGRITFNPIPHIDPIWTITIPIVAFFLSGGSFIIGGAKPVPVNPYNYRRPVLGDICVSVAGVAVNFLIAVIMILLINIVYLTSNTPAGALVIAVMLQVALLNIVLALFNLIPIPPLDGSHLVKYLLPRNLRAGYVRLGRTGAGFIILILLINMPGLWRIFSTVLFKLKDFLLESLIFF
jgi:Zn-dependent protease